MSSLSLCVVVCVLVACALGQTVTPVPLVQYNATYYPYEYTGTFQPNGTLSAGRSMSFSVNVKDVHSHYGLSVIPSSLYSSSYSYGANMTIFLKKGAVATAMFFDKATSFSCDSNQYSCFFVLTDGVGECDAKDGTYYFTVVNTGTVTATFYLDVGIDQFAGTYPFTCGAAGDIKKFLGFTFGIFLLVLLLPLLCCVGCIVGIVVCCVRSSRAKHVHHYVPVHQEHHHHHGGHHGGHH